MSRRVDDEDIGSPGSDDVDFVDTSRDNSCTDVEETSDNFGLSDTFLGRLLEEES